MSHEDSVHDRDRGRRQNPATAPEFEVPDDERPGARFVENDGLRLHVLDWNRGNREPALVFLHGAFLNAHTWDPVCGGLADRWRCVAVDFRGHGDSDWAPDGDYNRSQLAEDVIRIADRLGLGRLVLVGMSLGGLVALQVADRLGARVSGLVLVDIAPETSGAGGARRIAAFVNAATEFDTFEAAVAGARGFNSRRDPAILRASLAHALRQLPDGRWTWKYDPRTRDAWVTDAAVARHARRQNVELWDVLPRLACPTLVVRGAESDVLTREDADRVLAGLRDGSLAEVDAAGHIVQGDNPGGFLAALEPFLAPLTRAESSPPNPRNAGGPLDGR